MDSKSALSLLLGAAAGAIAGLLFAPEKGSVTRKKIYEAASEGYDDLKDQSGDLAQEVKVRARYARRQVKDLKDTVLEQSSGLKEDARVKILDQLEKIEKALSKDADSSEVNGPQL